jgi:hypothetical protein
MHPKSTWILYAPPNATKLQTAEGETRLTRASTTLQWSRLLAHTPLSSASSRKDFAKDPARRLHRFEKEYSQLLVSTRPD